MNVKEFAYTLKHILEEELPFIFEVETSKNKKGTDSYSIRVDLPDNFKFSFPKLDCYIGIDDLSYDGDLFEVYARHGDTGYENFGKVNDPLVLFTPIEEYLNTEFADIIERTENLDFWFSSELQDFLDYNKIPSRIAGDGKPHLRIDHPHYPFLYEISFSEHNDDVLVEVEKWAPSEQSWDKPYFYDGEQEELYRSSLSEKNKHKVFPEILAVLKKDGVIGSEY